MNALDQARTAYASPAAPVRTARGTEYDAFARVTRALRAGTGGPRRLDPALVNALHQNRRLWTLLASNVAETSNALPAQLRAQIFYLAEFTSKHTSDVLSGRADAEVLIEINTAIMQGLRDPVPDGAEVGA